MFNSDKNSASFLILLLGLVLGVSGCKEPAEADDLSFDQTALLTNLANIIVPHYEDFNTSLTRMETAATDFKNNPDATTLEILRSGFIDTYRDWPYISTFEFGPAADRSLRAQVNTFPTDTQKILSNASAGNYNLEQATNIDAKGLPALDYLLYGLGGDPSEVLVQFTDPTNGPGLMAYLDAVMADLRNSFDGILDAWNGSYRTTFIENLGTDVGSSLGLFVNEFNYDYELLKKPRLGIPLGIQTLGTPIPENVEAYYSGLSSDLLIRHFEAISNLYFGQLGATADGYGLDEALRDLEANYNGQLLADAIKDQIEQTRAALLAIPSPLSETVVNNPEPANNAYTEVQKLVVLFKTDMTSSLGILITYVDNDGD